METGQPVFDASRLFFHELIVATVHFVKRNVLVGKFLLDRVAPFVAKVLCKLHVYIVTVAGDATGYEGDHAIALVSEAVATANPLHGIHRTAHAFVKVSAGEVKRRAQNRTCGHTIDYIILSLTE